MKGLIIIVSLLLTGSAVWANDNDPKKKGTGKDTTTQATDNLESKGFKNLFASDHFNPTQPYATQINPKAIPFVEDYIAKHGNMLEQMKIWGQPYFRMMDQILESHGLPRELKYLAVIESHLKSWALSWAGAVGPWQFMPETARRMGLVVNGYRDERTDYYKSTHAAAKYLKELYRQLNNDWLLVIAGYNSGPGRVLAAMKKTGSKDFWELQYHLPQESRNHVKKFIGTHYLMEGAGGQTTVSAAEWAKLRSQVPEAMLAVRAEIPQELLEGTEAQKIQGKYNSMVIANHLAIDINLFNKLNPGFDKMVPEQQGYDLRLPKDKMDQFNAQRYHILHQSILANIQTISGKPDGYPEAKPVPTRRTR